MNRNFKMHDQCRSNAFQLRPGERDRERKNRNK